MIIRVADIPTTGREIDFDLDVEALNARVAEATAVSEAVAREQPACVFFSPVRAALKLTLEGSTVIIEGQTQGRYLTTCSRCAEETEQEISTKIMIVLKPQPDRGPVEALDEDLNFGFYTDKEVNCLPIVEEYLILALPYAVVCSNQCKGLCASCGQNLNVAQCDCLKEQEIDPRFAALKSLKLQH